jgi:hypothetical protein
MTGGNEGGVPGAEDFVHHLQTRERRGEGLREVSGSVANAGGEEMFDGIDGNLMDFGDSECNVLDGRQTGQKQKYIGAKDKVTDWDCTRSLAYQSRTARGMDAPYVQGETTIRTRTHPFRKMGP